MAAKSNASSGPRQSGFEAAKELFDSLFEPGEIILLRVIATSRGENQKVNSRPITTTYATAGDDASIEKALSNATARAEKEKACVFFGVNPRTHSDGRHNKQADILKVNAIYVDVDDHCAVEQLRARVKAAGLPEPSIIIGSGRQGWHVYWVLNTPISITDIASAGTRLSPQQEKTRGTIQRVSALIGGDHTQNLDRILRVPGTLNRKYARNGEEPKPCELIECVPDRRYSIDVFERATSTDAKLPTRKGKKSGHQSAQHTQKQLEKLDQLIRDCGSTPNGKRSERDFSLCCFAIENGFERTDIWLRVQQNGKFAESGEEYFHRTWNKAAAKAGRKFVAGARSTGRPADNGQETSARSSQVPSKVIIMSDVQPRGTSWLWDPWLPKKAIVFFDGDPGTGKSLIALDCIARVTVGRPMPSLDEPEGTIDPLNCLLLSAEDALAETIVPRLIAAGADRSRITTFGFARDARYLLPTLPSCIDEITNVVRSNHIKLVVLDVMSAFYDKDINGNSDGDVRRALSPLARACDELNFSVIAIRHLNKKDGQSALYRGAGSIAATGAARVVWLAGRDPNDTVSRVIAVSKNNLAPPPRSIRYQIVGHRKTARIEWGAECDLRADDILPEGKQLRDRKPTKPEQCARLIRDIIGDGSIPSAELKLKCMDAGFSEDTYKKARKHAGCQAVKEGFAKPDRWLTTISKTSTPSTEDDDLE